jgi:hypothetical protein
MGWCALAALAGLTAQPADLVPVAALLTAALLALAATRLFLGARPAPQHGRPQAGISLRERIRRRSVPRLCDPDARGRCRPRAPSPYPSAA